ncbi:hypothetical protein AciX9_0401 [Granulicella tundricola MP5ACTX9]|uniref:Outer membrane protein beta-barrel domain-containing protein n=1 Tax=Granulicella tundricola (strain ATCC BAA-1859 / DSM 23138 / MP5ACTX9) TaxID=1198114 RepID=E8WXE0_GRATM|nr:hypothetical protein AciX9_0401 [Granulicella tundricola MP5ACTX9]
MVERQRFCRGSLSRIALTPALATAVSVIGSVGLPKFCEAQTAVSSSIVTAEEDGGNSVDRPARRAAGQMVGPKLRLYDPAKIDLSLGVFPQLTPTRTVQNFGGEQIQGTTPSVGFLTTFHQQFHAWSGYEVNFAYTRLVENYISESGGATTSTGATVGTFTRGSIGTNVYELSGAYVAKGPGATRRLQTFMLGGPAMLIFQPTTKQYQGSSSVRAAVLFGSGVDYRLSDHLGLRVEYRGLFYKNPDFAAVISNVPVSKQFTVTNEPTVSLTYRFGAYRKMQ